MKRLSAAAILAMFLPAQVLAWGPMGHAMIADIAESRLSPIAKKNIRLLLGDESLASVSNWADEIKKDRPETFAWHFADIPKDAAGFSEARDCYRPNDQGPGAQTDRHNCIVDRVEMFRQVLTDGNASKKDRVEALKFLVHFVGDVHQPLHAIDEARGGNDIKVVVFGSDQCGNYACNLHWTWDQLLLEHAGYSEEDYVRHLEKLIMEKGLTARAGGTPEQWANESHLEARRIIEQKPVSIDDQYYQAHIDLVNEKLALAGLRLATVLNNALGRIPAAELRHNPERPRGL